MINQVTKSLLGLVVFSTFAIASNTTILIKTNKCLNKLHYHNGIHTAVHHGHKYITQPKKVIKKTIVVVKPPHVRPSRRTTQIR